MKSALIPNNLQQNTHFLIEDLAEPSCVIDVFETSTSNSDMTDEDDTMSSGGKYSAKENDDQDDVLWSTNRIKRSDDYRRRRQRNNMAVKKSRDKAKQRQRECARHLELLTAENKRLHMKAEVLMKELSLLKGLFPVVGLTPPPESEAILLAG